MDTVYGYVFMMLSPFMIFLVCVIMICCMRNHCKFCKPEETSRDQPVIRIPAINYTTSTELANSSRNSRTQNCQQILRVNLPQETILMPSQLINNPECDKPPSYESLFSWADSLSCFIIVKYFVVNIHLHWHWYQNSAIVHKKFEV